jgi:hypothetical protein
VHPDLEALLDLQERDQRVTAADEALSALEPEVAALDDALHAAERAVEQARRGVTDAVGRRETLEGKIASYRTMQEQRRQKLEWVRGAKEASTLMAELDLTRSVLAKEEAEYMRSGDAVTAAELRVQEAEQALEGVREAQAPEREALAGKIHSELEFYKGKYIVVSMDEKLTRPIALSLTKPIGLVTLLKIKVSIRESGMIDFEISRIGKSEDTVTAYDEVPVRSVIEAMAERSGIDLEE